MNLSEALSYDNNLTRTENGALTHKSTTNALWDLFALGGAYRVRSDEDCLKLFKDAYEENPLYAIRCLFYLRDIRGGQGERRFFRICLKWLAERSMTPMEKIAMNKIIPLIPEYGRWDDLYVLFDTQFMPIVGLTICNQLIEDLNSDHPSLLAKWLKSENTSSVESRLLARRTREHLNLSPAEYRRMLSLLRKKIRIVESQMSDNQWNKIDYGKLPSKAGFMYQNAFRRHDEERYDDFINSKNTTVNAATLYPYEVVEKALDCRNDRNVVNKYWDNLTDYFKDKSLNAICVVDTSGSMCGTPMNVAISLGLYCAERNKGAFHNKFITFSSRPRLVEAKGLDFVDKVRNIEAMNICENTDIHAVFVHILATAVKYKVKPEDMPKSVIVISDMEFDQADVDFVENDPVTQMERLEGTFARAGYELPNLVFWNVDARQDNIPALGSSKYTYISGFSAATFEMLMFGKTGYEFMMDTLNNNRYAQIKL